MQFLNPSPGTAHTGTGKPAARKHTQQCNQTWESDAASSAWWRLNAALKGTATMLVRVSPEAFGDSSSAASSPGPRGALEVGSPLQLQGFRVLSRLGLVYLGAPSARPTVRLVLLPEVVYLPGKIIPRVARTCSIRLHFLPKLRWPSLPIRVNIGSKS